MAEEMKQEDVVETEETLEAEVPETEAAAEESEAEKQAAQIEELNDKVKRTMAEFDNFRKRTEKEKAVMFEIGARSVIEKMLPVIDNFERGLGTVSPEEKEGGFGAGMEMIYRQLMTSMEELGVAPIEALGQEFDPNLHNAVMHVEDEEAGENVIVEEFQKGYTYRGSVIRYSMVKVAN